MLTVCVVGDLGAILIRKLVATVDALEIFGPDVLFTMRTRTMSIEASPRDR